MANCGPTLRSPDDDGTLPANVLCGEAVGVSERLGRIFIRRLSSPDQAEGGETVSLMLSNQQASEVSENQHRKVD
ncbi:hypothetical protein N7490_011606 [Penicillium lividum]|nr:hypothetical protein N7490_011606 [Penicillium lividum]